MTQTHERGSSFLQELVEDQTRGERMVSITLLNVRQMFRKVRAHYQEEILMLVVSPIQKHSHYSTICSILLCDMNIHFFKNIIP